MSFGGSYILAGTGTDDPEPLCVFQDGAATGDALCECFGDLDARHPQCHRGRGLGAFL